MIVFKPRLILFYGVFVVLFAVLSNVETFKLEQERTVSTYSSYATIVETSR